MKHESLNAVVSNPSIISVTNKKEEIMNKEIRTLNTVIPSGFNITDAKGVEFEGFINNGSATLTDVDASVANHDGGLDIIVPSHVNGYPLTKIASGAFWGVECFLVHIPDTVREIEEGAFEECHPDWNVDLPISCNWAPGAFDPGTRLQLQLIGTHDPNGFQYFIVNDDATSLTMSGWDGLGGWLPRTAWNKHRITAYEPSKLWSAKWLGIPKDMAEKVVLGPTDIQGIEYDPGTVHIPDEAFAGSMRLTTVLLHDGIEVIGQEAFEFCSLNKIRLPKSLLRLGPRAFLGNDITAVTIPDSVTYIGKDAFSDCPKLESLAIPASVPVQKRRITDERVRVQYPDAWVTEARAAWHRYCCGFPLKPWAERVLATVEE